MSAIWHKLLKLLILHALILVSNILIKVIYSLCELLFQKYVVQARILDEIAPERSQELSLTKRGARYCPAAAEGEQQRRTKESVIGVVGNAFPDHPQAEQHRREEGEQGGGDKNTGHGGASESAYAGY